MRFVTIVLLVAACSSGAAGSGAGELPLTPEARSLLGCYRVVFVGRPAGDVFRWGSDWAPNEVVIRLDSTSSVWGGRAATFVEGMPAELRKALVHWSRSLDSVVVRQEAGKEGQGIRMSLALAGDSASGQALWHWSIDGTGVQQAPLRGAKSACP